MMAPVVTKRRRGEEEARRPKKKIKVKRQAQYHSSSEDEDDDAVSDAPTTKAIAPQTTPKSILKRSVPTKHESQPEDDSAIEDEEGVDEVEKNTALNAAQDEDSEEDDQGGEEYGNGLVEGVESDDDEEMDSESEVASMTASNTSSTQNAKKKRNDPDAFATSISKILDTKLTTFKRQDPVLSRSKAAAETHKSLADNRLEQKAKAQIKAEKKQALEKGRVKDVLGLENANVDTGARLEEEKRLKKTAQRGVVKLFNAVRAAQVKAEEGVRQTRDEGVVGMKKREETVNEMSKQGFLDLISSGGKKAAAAG